MQISFFYSIPVLSKSHARNRRKGCNTLSYRYKCILATSGAATMRSHC